MKSITEKIGYIDQKQFNLDTVVNSIVEFMTSPDIHWDTNYEVKGKPNVKDLEGFLYHTFTFDLDNPKLGFIKVILVNIDTDKVNTSYKFQGFIDGDDAAFYSPVDSTVDKKKNNCGYIYINYNTFKGYIANKEELIDELKEYVYHELRHYYDNIMGVFGGPLKELLHITLIADEFNINSKVFKEKTKEALLKKDTTYKSLKTLLYVSQPTELNAWYHSFVQNMMVYTKKNPNATKDDILKYIETPALNNNDYACFIYSYAIVYKTFGNYSKAINGLCGQDPIKLFYYITNTLNECNPSDKTIKQMNDLFDKNYINYFTDTVDYKTFGTKLSAFINDYYMHYVYKKIAPKYLHTYKNMQKFISTLV